MRTRARVRSFPFPLAWRRCFVPNDTTPCRLGCGPAATRDYVLAASSAEQKELWVARFTREYALSNGTTLVNNLSRTSDAESMQAFCDRPQNQPIAFDGEYCHYRSVVCCFALQLFRTRSLFLSRSDRYGQLCYAIMKGQFGPKTTQNVVEFMVSKGVPRQGVECTALSFHRRAAAARLHRGVTQVQSGHC